MRPTTNHLLNAFLTIYASDDLVTRAAFDRAFDELFDVRPEQPSRAVLPVVRPIVQLDHAQRPARGCEFELRRRNVEFARSGVEAHQILAVVNTHLLFSILKSD